MTEVREDRKAQLYALPVIVAGRFHISPPSVLEKAQPRIAIHAIGTITLLAMNSHRRLFGCIYKNGICASQKRKKEIMVLVSMPWSAGMWFFIVRNDGQIAPSITRTVLAPFMVWMANQKIARIAREMIAI
jgi:hypothetical protein